MTERVAHIKVLRATLEATRGKIVGFFGQLPYKCHQNRVASVGDCVEICPWVTSKVVVGNAACVSATQ